MPAFWHKGCQTKSRLALMCQHPRAPTVPLSAEPFTGGIEHMDVIQRKRTIGSIIPRGTLITAVGALLAACGEDKRQLRRVLRRPSHRSGRLPSLQMNATLP